MKTMKGMSSDAFKKRFKLTNRGKVVGRKSHIGHNQAKLSSNVQRRHDSSVVLTNSNKKRIKRYL